MEGVRGNAATSYDRNRADYYQTIQSVREQVMEMIEWVEYFVQGLCTQLPEVNHWVSKLLFLSKKFIHELISCHDNVIACETYLLI